MDARARIRRNRQKGEEYVTTEEFDEHVEEERKMRREINARLRAIEVEYGLDLKPFQPKPVNGE